MSHTITDCPRCQKDFMYHQTDFHLHRNRINEDILKEYPIQDPIWSSRRWDKNGDYQDMSGDLEDYIVICQDCHEKEKLETKTEKV